MQFSLFYFAADQSACGPAAYELLLEGARFGDRHGLSAVWVPERHFEPFGAIYPNPSVLAAALATITHRIELRAGSVVAPLHHPIRIAEEWAVVDNLSNGRVAISFAPGWAANDFALAQEAFPERRRLLVERIDTVRRLWRGEALTTTSGEGGEIQVVSRPRPVQPELRFWLSTGGSGRHTRTPELAGQLGGNILTHVISQTPENLAARIETYRRARAEAGHDPATGVVSVMLHTYVCDDSGSDLDRVRSRLAGYVGGSIDLGLAQDWPGGPAQPPTERQRHLMVELAVSRYLDQASLIGPRSVCADRVRRLRALGVDEIACLVDFGLGLRDTMASLERLLEVQEAVQEA